MGRPGREPLGRGPLGRERRTGSGAGPDSPRGPARHPARRPTDQPAPPAGTWSVSHPPSRPPVHRQPPDPVGHRGWPRPPGRRSSRRAARVSRAAGSGNAGWRARAARGGAPAVEQLGPAPGGLLDDPRCRMGQQQGAQPRGLGGRLAQPRRHQPYVLRQTRRRSWPRRVPGLLHRRRHAVRGLRRRSGRLAHADDAGRGLARGQRVVGGVCRSPSRCPATPARRPPCARWRPRGCARPTHPAAATVSAPARAAAAAGWSRRPGRPR